MAARSVMQPWLHSQLLVLGCWGFVMLTGLAGCAANSALGDFGAPRQDISTPSEESEARRRARIRLELAVNYFDQGQTNIALDEVRQSLATDPNFAEAYNLRGLIYMRLNDARTAEDDFRRALAITPADGNILHNYAWLMCQERRYADAETYFGRALSIPTYTERAKTLMGQGLCKARSGQRAEAELVLLRSYELDPANPVTGFNIALLMFQRGEFTRAQFYIRRLNNSDYANAGSLWLGIRVERKMGDKVAMQQLVDQLRKRFPQSKELAAYEKGSFDE